MKKLSNLGKVLSKAQQKEVFGGGFPQEEICFGGTACSTDADCCVAGATCVQNFTTSYIKGIPYTSGSMVCSI